MSEELDRKVLRLEKLSEAKEKLEDLMKQMEDPAMSKDISENSPRDQLLAQIDSQQKIVERLEQNVEIPEIPGTWNINDKAYVEYSRVVSYGKDVAPPEKQLLIQLVEAVDITEYPLGTTPESLEIVTTPINSPLGRAMLHKAHSSVRFNTPTGYCEVRLERCVT